MDSWRNFIGDLRRLGPRLGAPWRQYAAHRRPTVSVGIGWAGGVTRETEGEAVDSGAELTVRRESLPTRVTSDSMAAWSRPATRVSSTPTVPAGCAAYVPYAVTSGSPGNHRAERGVHEGRGRGARSVAWRAPRPGWGALAGAREAEIDDDDLAGLGDLAAWAKVAAATGTGRAAWSQPPLGHTGERRRGPSPVGRGQGDQGHIDRRVLRRPAASWTISSA